MVVDNTLYRNEGSQRKQLTMEGYAAFALTSKAHISKGLAAYECLLLTNEEYSDDLTQSERRVFDELEDVVGADVRPALREVITSRMSDARADLIYECDYADPEERIDNVDVYLPVSLVDDLPGRGAGDLIAESVVHTVASPWRSRIGRLRDLQDLLTYARTRSLPSDASEFVQSVASGDSNKFDIAPLAGLFDVEEEFFEDEGLALSVLRARAEEVPKTAAPRATALENALRNEDRTYSREAIIDEAMDVFGCVKSSAEGYADLIDLDDSQVFEFGVMEKVSKIADDARSRTKKTLTAPDWKLAGLTGSPEDVDGEYDDEFDAAAAVAAVKKNTANLGRGDPDHVHYGQKQLLKWVDAKEEERLALFDGQ